MKLLFIKCLMLIKVELSVQTEMKDLENAQNICILACVSIFTNFQRIFSRDSGSYYQFC